MCDRRDPSFRRLVRLLELWFHCRLYLQTQQKCPTSPHPNKTRGKRQSLEWKQTWKLSNSLALQVKLPRRKELEIRLTEQWPLSTRRQEMSFKVTAIKTKSSHMKHLNNACLIESELSRKGSPKFLIVFLLIRNLGTNNLSYISCPQEGHNQIEFPAMNFWTK